jgi:DNA replication protein DnaC
MRYRHAEWGDFRFDRGGEANRAKVNEFREYAESFPVEGKPTGVRSLMLASEVNGVGKTLLECLMLKDIIMRFEGIGREVCPYQFWPVYRIKQRIKAAERYGGPETVEDVYKDLCSVVWLLVIDDVGKERLDGSDAGFTYDMYFSILNGRYNEDLPVIISSNLIYKPWVHNGLSLIDVIGLPAVSRLCEMTHSQVYIIEGESWR